MFRRHRHHHNRLHRHHDHLLQYLFHHQDRRQAHFHTALYCLSTHKDLCSPVFLHWQRFVEHRSLGHLHLTRCMMACGAGGSVFMIGTHFSPCGSQPSFSGDGRVGFATTSLFQTRA